MNINEKVSQAGDVISRAVSVASSKKEFIGKQIINGALLFVILLVFGCLDFATLSFHFEYLAIVSYWSTVGSKVVAGMCAFNIGINFMWETELKKDKILESAIKIYEILIKEKKDDFEYYVVHVFNPEEKKKSYISQINHKIFQLNKLSRAKDRLLYSSELVENQAKKLKNRYCIKRQELEDLKKEEFIAKNIDALKVHYREVDATIFDLEIDGSPAVKGVKTKGNVSLGKARETSTMALGIVAFSMFATAIGLEMNKEVFEDQMTAFWHYCLKCATDIGIVLWQLTKGMLKTRKIISSELTQTYVGRNKVLLNYLKWRTTNGSMPESDYKSIDSQIRNIGGEEEYIEITQDELESLKEKK